MSTLIIHFTLVLNTFVSGGLWHSRSSSPSPSSATSLNHVTASLLLVMSSPSTCTLYKWETSRSFFNFFFFLWESYKWANLDFVTNAWLFRFSGNEGSVSFLCGEVWSFPWIHRLVHCLLREPGGRRRNCGAKHRPQLWVKTWKAQKKIWCVNS